MPVSSEDQAGSGLGLEVQRLCNRATCEQNGMHLAEILEHPSTSERLHGMAAGCYLGGGGNFNVLDLLPSKAPR
jgi:hypothetical protein